MSKYNFNIDIYWHVACDIGMLFNIIFLSKQHLFDFIAEQDTLFIARDLS